jgi:hypothetical protein
MSQLYLKGVYYDAESATLQYLNNSGSYDSISVGGGEASFLVKSMPITNTQILTLGALGFEIEIIPAPGEGKFINFIMANFTLFVATPYTNITTTVSRNLTFSNTNDDMACAILNEDIDSLFTSGGRAAFLPLLKLGINAPQAAYLQILSQLNNQPLHFEYNNRGDGALTGGSESNNGLIKVWYTIEDIPT